MESGHLNPARLPPGTHVGPWRVVERRGWGAYGAVYRAFGVGDGLGPVALKLALHRGDERFAREAELLSRIRSPHVPRLVDHGDWRQPGGGAHPYLALEWVEGVPLYEWARVRCPTSRQVLHVLAGLARALEAVHSVGGVHRDVKGDNVLVSAADGQVFLTDFGSGHYVGAATLTSPPFPPGTPAYRSPEAWRSVRLPLPKPATPYAPGPADDVFALGTTAYRLVTGEYPPTEEAHAWGREGTEPRPLSVLNVRCCAELSEGVSRMLSVRPEARGSARELAEALEQAAREAGPEADVPLLEAEALEPVEIRVAPRSVVPDVPLFEAEALEPVDVRAVPPHAVPRAVGHARWGWLTAASLGGAVTLGFVWLLDARPGVEDAPVQASAPEEGRDGGTVAVGDSALTAPVSPQRDLSVWSIIALEVPPRPLPGQTRPDANGRCPGKTLVHINGGCWMRLAVGSKECDESFGQYVHKDACYSPAFRSTRPPTSGPTGGAEDSTP